MCKNLFAVVLIFSIALTETDALEFDVSPNPDGTVDTKIALEWEYGNGFFSGVLGQYQTAQEQVEESDRFVATMSKTFTVESDLLGFKTNGIGVSASIAANGKYDRMNIREIGYIDSSGTRFFVLNDRIIDLAYPRIHGSVALSWGPFDLEAGGEWAPFLAVWLDQKLTISPGMPETPFTSFQTGMNAFSVTAGSGLRTPLVLPSIKATYDFVPIAYEAMTAGGKMRFDSLIEVLTIQGTISFDMIPIGGVRPSISLAWEGSRTTDRGSTDSTISSEKWSFGVGFR